MLLSPSLQMPDEAVTLIGAIVSWWSATEQTLFDDIMLARCIPAVHATNVAWPIQIATKRLITQWRDVANILAREYAITVDLDSLELRMRRMNDIRNLIVHGFYDYNFHHRQHTVANLRWDDDLGTFVNEPFVVDVGSLAHVRAAAEMLHDDVTAWTEWLYAAAKDRRTKDSKAAKPSWPEVLDLAPKPLQV